MGDTHAGLYIDPDLPEIIKGRLLPLADIVTPNPFEFAILVGAKLSGFAQFSGEAERWLRHGMRHVLVTGCLLDDTPLGQLDTLLVSDGCRFRLRSPRLTGDRAGTELGRASGRERVCHYVSLSGDAGCLKK